MPAPDFRLYHGNDLDVLAGVLAAELARGAAGQDPLVPDTVLIPQPSMRRWLQKTLAETHGVAANLAFLTPGEFVAGLLAANLPSPDDAASADTGLLRWRLWSLLDDAALGADPVFAPLAPVLAAPQGGVDPAAAWSLAGELAQAFETYQAWRRDWLLAWDRGGDPGDWQAALWRRATRGQAHRAQRLEAYLRRFGGPRGEAPAGVPPRVFAFACQNVSPDVLRVIASAARAAPLHFFFVSPVEGWWGDLRGARERLAVAAAGQAPEAAFEDAENPLLRADGAAGRDFVRVLFDPDLLHPSWEQAIYVAPDPHRRPGLLHTLQRDLLARRAPEAPTRRFDPADRSLQVHACHTRLREVQVLHEQLRALLEADPALEPRDIAVLTPDIDAYAPVIHAVFGAQPPALALPYAVADGSPAAVRPLVDWFLRLLALPQSRFGANEILALLTMPAVAERLGLQAADAPRLAGWLQALGARWGLDAAHRREFALAPGDAPAAEDALDAEAYTWVWALDRALFGHAAGSEADIAGVAAWPRLEGDALRVLDALLHGLRALARLRAALRRAATPAAWRGLLARGLEDLLPEQPADAADARAAETVRAALARFQDEAERAGVAEPVPPEVLRAWFRAALGTPDLRQPFLSGGVTFGRMVPMRLIPFRVICLLGMDDGAFPRRDPAGALNRLAAELDTPRRRVGDRSLRDDDRFLFLQLFAAAGDVFYLSYLGTDPREGTALPPSVVVAELLDAAAAHLVPEPGLPPPRERLVLAHPLQPFAAQAFGAARDAHEPAADAARRVGFDPRWRPAAETGPAAARRGLPPFSAGLLPARAAPDAAEPLDAQALLRVLRHPPRAFLRERLDLRLAQPGDALPETEPFDDDGRRRHAVGHRVFAALRAGQDEPEALRRRLLAEGMLAPGAAGAGQVMAQTAALRASAEAARDFAPDPAAHLDVRVALGAHDLVARLDDVHAAGLLQFHPGRLHGGARLALALRHLLWSAAGQVRPLLRLLPGEAPQLLEPIPAAQARAALATLLALHDLAVARPLPLMPRSAWVYVERLRDGRPETAFGEARKHWRDSDRRPGEGEDAWVRLALRGADPFADDADPALRERFGVLARILFDALDGQAAAVPA